MYKIVALVIGLAVSVSAITTFASTPASAAALPGTCVSNGYSFLKQYPITMKKGSGYEVQTGTLEVYYKSSTGKNCVMAKCSFGWCWENPMYRVVAIRESKPGPQTTWEGWDGGMYEDYAGPVVTSRSTAGKCIDVYAGFTQSASDSNPTKYGGFYRENIHCS